MAKKTGPQGRLMKKLELMRKEDQVVALRRIEAARRFGWTNIDWWDEDDGMPFLSDLVGISPNGTFDFLPVFTSGD